MCLWWGKRGSCILTEGVINRELGWERYTQSNLQNPVSNAAFEIALTSSLAKQKWNNWNRSRLRLAKPPVSESNKQMHIPTLNHTSSPTLFHESYASALTKNIQTWFTKSRPQVTLTTATISHLLSLAISPYSPAGLCTLQASVRSGLSAESFKKDIK